MKKVNNMSSHGSMTTIVYGGTFELRKEYIEKHINTIGRIQKIYIDLISDDYKSKDLRNTIYQTEFSTLDTSSRVFIFYNSHRLSALMQNMLLKTLEEPNKNIQFILESSSYNSLLSTIQSRSNLIKVDTSDSVENNNLIDYPTRKDLSGENISQIFKIVENFSTNKQLGLGFVGYLLSETHQILVSNSVTNTQDQQKLIAYTDFLLQCHEWIENTNVSTKTILENAVLGYRQCILV
jgi:hypothetical protein